MVFWYLLPKQTVCVKYQRRDRMSCPRLPVTYLLDEVMETEFDAAWMTVEEITATSTDRGRLSGSRHGASLAAE